MRAAGSAGDRRLGLIVRHRGSRERAGRPADRASTCPARRIRHTCSCSTRRICCRRRRVQALQDSARALQTETAADVAWVTLPTLGGRPIEEAALYIGRTWRIGSAGQPGDPLRNRGLVILFIPDKTTTAGSNFRIEVGNGLEGTITDSRSRAISLGDAREPPRETLRRRVHGRLGRRGGAGSRGLRVARRRGARRRAAAAAVRPVRPCPRRRS